MRVFLTVTIACLAVFSLFSGLDAKAIQIYDATFDRAIYAFGLAKGLNAVISVLQSSEVNFSIFVAGGTIGIGEILDPINDLVERFSMVMLIASVSLGVQHLLLILGKSMFLKVLLVALSAIVVVGIWVKKLNVRAVFSLSVKLFVLLIILRFGAVVFVYANELLYNEIYAKEYKASSTYIDSYKDNLEVLKQDQKRLSSSLSGLESKSEAFTKKVIGLITIFIISTILFPLIYIWLFVLLFKYIINIKISYDIVLPRKIKEIS